MRDGTVFGLHELRLRGEALMEHRGMPLRGNGPARRCARAALSQLPWTAQDLPDLRTANVLDHAASEEFGRIVTFDPDLRMWTMSPHATPEDLTRAADGIGDLIERWEAVEEVMGS